MRGFGNLLTTRTAMFAVTGFVTGALIIKGVRKAYKYFYGDAEKEDLSSIEQPESDFNSSGPEISTCLLQDVKPSITEDEGMNSLSLKVNITDVKYSYGETEDGSSTLEKPEYDSNGGFGLELATGLLRDVEPSVFQEEKGSGHQTSVSVVPEPLTEKPFSGFMSDQVTTSDLDAFEFRESVSKSPREYFTGNEEKFVVFREKQLAAVLETAFGDQAAEIPISAQDFSEQRFDDLSATSGEDDGYSVFFTLKEDFGEIQSEDPSSGIDLCEGDCSATTEELFDENDENSLSLGQKQETSPSFTELEAFMEGEVKTSPVSAEDYDYVSDGSEMLHDAGETWSEPESDSLPYDDSDLPYMDEGMGCKLGLETDVKELNCENGAPLSVSYPDTERGEDVGPSRTKIIWENQDDDQIDLSTFIENFEEIDEISVSLEENEEMSPTDEGLEDIDDETSVFSEGELSEGDTSSDSEENYDLLSGSFERYDEDEASCSEQEDEDSLPEHESHAEYLTSASPAAETFVSEQELDEGKSSPSWSPGSRHSDGEGETQDALNDDEEETCLATEDRFNHKPDDFDTGATISSVSEVDEDLSSEDTNGLLSGQAEIKRLNEFDALLVELGLQDLVCDNVDSGSPSSPHDESLDFLEDGSEAPLASQASSGSRSVSSDVEDEDLLSEDTNGLLSGQAEIKRLKEFNALLLKLGLQDLVCDNVASGSSSSPHDESLELLEDESETPLASPPSSGSRSVSSDVEDEDLSSEDTNGLLSGQAEIKRLNEFNALLLKLGLQDLVCDSVASGSPSSSSGKELDEDDVDMNRSDVKEGVAGGLELDTNTVQMLWDVAESSKTSQRTEESNVEKVSSGEKDDGRSLSSDEELSESDEELSESDDEISLSSDEELSESDDEISLSSDEELSESDEELSESDDVRSLSSDEELSESDDEISLSSDEELSESDEELSESDDEISSSSGDEVNVDINWSGLAGDEALPSTSSEISYEQTPHRRRKNNGCKVKEKPSVSAEKSSGVNKSGTSITGAKARRSLVSGRETEEEVEYV